MTRAVLIGGSAENCGFPDSILSMYDGLEIVGSTADPYLARDMVANLKPDVVALDLEAPRLNGLVYLAKLMKHYPTPVVVLSSSNPESIEAALNALEVGAVDVVGKPDSAVVDRRSGRRLVRILQGSASEITIADLSDSAGDEVQTCECQKVVQDKLIAVGASTGGTVAIRDLLRRLPATVPGILIVQHMPDGFTSAFVSRLNQLCGLEVREAREGDKVTAGLALIAPANRHMIVCRDTSGYIVSIKTGPRVHYERPSVDVLFRSVASCAGPNAVGVLLTGMGGDGANGLLEMRRMGAHTIVQDQNTCVSFGMPGHAVKLNAAQEVLPLPQIAQAIVNSLTQDNSS